MLVVISFSPQKSFLSRNLITFPSSEARGLPQLTTGMFFNPILSSSSCLISPLAILCWDCNVTWRHITTRSLLKKPCMQYGGREISDTREDNFCFSWLLPNLICRSPWWGWISIHWRVPAVRNGWWMWKGSGGWWMPHFLIWPTCPPSYSPFQILFFCCKILT